VVGESTLTVRGVVGLGYKLPVQNFLRYVVFGRVDSSSVSFINKCRTICAVHPTFEFISVTNKNVYDFLVKQLGFVDIMLDVVETPLVKTRTNVGGSRACNFLETDVKSVYSRSDIMNIDDFINAEDTIWCAFKESSDVRDKSSATRKVLPEFSKLRCHYLTAPQIQYIEQQSKKKEHYLEAYKRLERSIPLFVYAHISKAFEGLMEADFAECKKYVEHSPTFSNNTTLRLIASRMDEFSPGHLVRSFVISTAIARLINDKIIDILDRLSDYEYVTRRTSRMLRYYRKYCKIKTIEADEIKSKFFDTYPLLAAFSSYFRYTGAQGKQAADQLIEYLHKVNVK
jgi:hypothetical protein